MLLLVVEYEVVPKRHNQVGPHCARHYTNAKMTVLADSQTLGPDADSHLGSFVPPEKHKGDLKTLIFVALSSILSWERLR